MRFSLIFFFFLTFQLTFSQEKASQVTQGELVFGDIEKADLEMSFYPLDSAANAVILYRNGKVAYDRKKLKFYFEFHSRVKILTKEAFDRADIEVPFVLKRGTEISAATHVWENGKQVSHVVPEEDIREREVVEGVFTKQLSFPNVVEGAILEYKFKTFDISPYSLMTWYFQADIPVRYSEYLISFPGRRLTPRLYGGMMPTGYTRSVLGHECHIIMEDLPAFEEEPYVRFLDDHYSKVIMEPISSQAYSWVAVNQQVMELNEFGKTLTRLQVLDKFYPEEKGWTDDEKSLKEIHAYVANHFKWDGNYALSISDKPKKVWAKEEANSADINLMLLMFLRRAGFYADPVFLSTLDHGLINKEFITFRQFNNLVIRTWLGNKMLLVDATNPNRPYNVLPDNCINDIGLVMKEGRPEWVQMNMNQERVVQTINSSYQVEPSGKLNGTASMLFSNSAAADVRMAFNAERDGTSENSFEDDFKEEAGEMKLSNLEFEGLDDPYAYVKMTMDFDSEESIDRVGDRLYLTPVVFKEMESNPFLKEERRLPVDFIMPITKRYMFNVTIPEGYEVEELPEPVTFVMPNKAGSYAYHIQKTEEGFQILIRFNINQLTFLPDQYPAIRKIFSLIISKQEELVVLKKSETED